MLEMKTRHRRELRQLLKEPRSRYIRDIFYQNLKAPDSPGISIRDGCVRLPRANKEFKLPVLPAHESKESVLFGFQNEFFDQPLPRVSQTTKL